MGSTVLKVRYIDVPGTMGCVAWQKRDEIRTQEGDRIFIDGKPCGKIEDIPDSAVSVTIVSVPAAPAVVAAVAIIGGILAVGSGVVAGVAIAKNEELRREAERAQKQAQKFSEIDRPNPAASIRGGNNRYRPNGRVPLIFGEHYHVPDLCGTPYTSYQSDEQWYHQLFCLGYSDVQYSDPEIGDNPLSHYEAVLSDGTLQYPRLVSELTIGSELQSGESAVHTTPDGTTEIEIGITFPAGLRHYDEDANEGSASVLFNIKISAETGYNSDNNYSISANADYVRRRFSVSLSPASYTVTVRRITEGRDAVHYLDTAYWDVLTCRIQDLDGNTDPVSDGFLSECKMVSLKIKSTSQLSGIVDKFNVMARLSCRDYSGSGTGPISWLKRPTRNPASAMLYLLTDEHVGKNPVPDSKIIWEDFEAWHVFCTAKGFSFDAVVSGDYTIEQISSMIAAAGRGVLYAYNGHFGVRTEEKSGSIDFQLTPRNTRGGMSLTRKFKDVPDSLTIKWIDRDSGYQEVSRTIGIDGDGVISFDVEPGKDTDEMSLIGITGTGQAMKIGAFELAKLNRRTMQITVPQDFEHLSAFPGAVGYLASDMFLYGLSSGKVKSIAADEGGNSTGVSLDEPVYLESDESYSIMVRMNGESDGVQIFPVTGLAESGVVYEAAFESPVEAGKIEVGNQYIIGKRGKEALKVQCVSISQQSDNAGTLVLVPYAQEIFDADSGEIPPWDPGIILPKETITAPAYPVDRQMASVKRNALKSAAQRPTYRELADGWEYAPEGVPKATIIPDSVELTAEGAYGSIILRMNRQQNLTNFLHYELQVSDDNAAWHSLRMDGLDWRGAADEWTAWQGDTLVHPGILPAVDEDGDPVGRTLCYRVRRIARAAPDNFVSDMSSASAVTTLVEAGSIATGAVTANTIEVSVLNALIANIKDNLTVGQATGYTSYKGAGSVTAPEVGDRIVHLDNDELLVSRWGGGSWEPLMRLGGDDLALELYQDGTKRYSMALDDGVAVGRGVLGLADALMIGERRIGPISLPFDGTSWTARTSGTTAYLRDARYANGLWVINGDSGTILTSTDGTSWTARASGTTVTLLDARYANGLWVINGDSGTLLTSTDGIDWTQRASGTTVTLWDVRYADGLWVVTGASGTILTSVDGTSWTARASGTTVTLLDARYANGLWVIVGYSGTILTSVDGTSWTARASGTTVTLLDARYANGLWVAVGSSGTILTSVDGTSWTARASGTTVTLLDARYANGLWVAVGSSGTILTSVDGTSWTARASGTTVTLWDALYADGLWVAVGYYGTILTSNDGTSWTARASGTTQVLRDAYHGNGLWVVVGSGGTILTSVTTIEEGELPYAPQSAQTGLQLQERGLSVLHGDWEFRVWPITEGETDALELGIFSGGAMQMKSTLKNGIMSLVLAGSLTALGGCKVPAGVEWETVTPLTIENLYEVRYGNGLWVAVGDSGTILTSTDGITWTARVSGTTAYLRDARYANGLWVINGDSGTILTSTDGTSWTARASGTTVTLLDARYANGLWVINGDSGTLLTSTDGISWTKRVSGTTVTLLDARYANGLWVAVGSSGTILTSTDGTSWTARASGTTVTLWDARHANGLWVIVGYSGTILTSPDGITWTVRVSGTAQNLYEVRHANGLWVVAGYSGTLLTSPDGITWTVRDSGTEAYLYEARYGNGLWVVVGSYGTLLTSTDGTSWTARTSGTTAYLRDARYANGLWVAVGGGGTILTSRELDIWENRNKQ